MIGFVSKKWGIAQQYHFRELGFRRTGKSWLTALIKKLWNVSWDMWEHRNGILHDALVIEEEEKKASKLILEIQEQKRKGIQGLANYAKKLLEKPIDELKMSTNKKKEQWLKSIYRAREKKQIDGEKMKKQRELMRKWLESAEFQE